MTHDLSLKGAGAREAFALALQSAFSADTLARMVAEKLDERLEDIAIGTLPQLVRGLIKEHESRSTLRLLLAASRATNRTNEDLVAFAAQRTRRSFDKKPGQSADVFLLDALCESMDELGESASSPIADLYVALTKGALPSWCPSPVPGPVRHALLGQLAEIDSHTGAAPPLLTLVMTLAARDEGAACRKKLVGWARAVAEQMGLDSALVRALPPPITKIPMSSYVMVRLVPNQMGDQILATAWIHSDGAAHEVWRGEAQNLDGVRDALGKELKRRGSKLEIALHGVPNDRITYEFILRRSELDQKVEEWRIGVGGLPIGKLHRVVVRSYERIYEHADRGWSTKWAFLKSAAPGAPRRVRWFDPTRDSSDDAFTLEITNDTSVIGLAFVGPLSACPSGDPLAIGIELGVPIVLWPRCACPASREGMTPIVGALELATHDVRDAVLSVRKEQAPDDDVRRNLALLWDDPERVPPLDDLVDVSY